METELMKLPAVPLQLHMSKASTLASTVTKACSLTLQMIYHTPALHLGSKWDDGCVVLKKMVFDCFPLINTPLLPFTLVMYSVCQACNPQLFNVCLQRAMSHIKCLLLWKGNILILKYDHEEETLTNISYVDVTLCHVLMQTTIVRG